MGPEYCPTLGSMFAGPNSPDRSAEDDVAKPFALEESATPGMVNQDFYEPLTC